MRSDYHTPARSVHEAIISSTETAQDPADISETVSSVPLPDAFTNGIGDIASANPLTLSSPINDCCAIGSLLVGR